LNSGTTVRAGACSGELVHRPCSTGGWGLNQLRPLTHCPLVGDLHLAAGRRAESSRSGGVDSVGLGLKSPGRPADGIVAMLLAFREGWALGVWADRGWHCYWGGLV